MARVAEPRRAVPMKLQRDLALLQLADALRRLGEVETGAQPKFELDHDPALSLRPINPETGHHIPHQHDPAGLLWRTDRAHDRKTNGRGGERRISTLDSDTHTAAHTRRLTEQQQDFRRNLLRKGAGEPRPPSKWPKRPDGGWPPPGSRKLQSHKTQQKERPDAHR